MTDTTLTIEIKIKLSSDQQAALEVADAFLNVAALCNSFDNFLASQPGPGFGAAWTAAEGVLVSVFDAEVASRLMDIAAENSETLASNLAHRADQVLDVKL